MDVGAAGDGVTIGPILLGTARPIHILTPTATVRRIVNMTALTVVDCNAARTQAPATSWAMRNGPPWRTTHSAMSVASAKFATAASAPTR